MIKKFIVVCLFILTGQTLLSQSSVWNNNSFKFSKDVAVLEDMTGTSVVPFNNGPVYSSAAIGIGGFSFHYGLSFYSSLYISPYGFIKLGSPVSYNEPAKDTSTIAALYNGTSWVARCKNTGTAPDRKFVIDFTGVMQPSGEPTSFQIWLYERTGKIQFVYQQLRGFYGFPSLWSYEIFCNASIMNKNTMASVKINPNNASPSVNYSLPILNFDSIYPNTRFTFQPDTIRPVNLSSLGFSNVMPGCLSVDIAEASANESLITLERADSGTNYFKEKLYYVTIPAGSTTYHYAQTFIQPFWNYKYRAYVSNGFFNSDTLFNAVQTPMPLLNGIQKIPGDYPSVTALLQDARCKHLGPNLVIELQNNYSFAAETLPISFGNNLQNRLIQSIIIRPAANASINWTAATRTALFYVDSVKHVFLDGRPGGSGTVQGFTIFQQNPQAATIQYTNTADSGGINYCKILKKYNTVYSANYAIVIESKDSTFSYVKKPIDAFSLTNNFISADSGSVTHLVYIISQDSTSCKNFVISGNQFSRFRADGIYVEKGGNNLLISNNHFFQPEPIVPQTFLPVNTSTCIKLYNTETATIDNNYFGGSDANWGTGRYILNSNTGSKYNFIHYENTSLTKKAFILNNKFGNIHTNCLASLGGAETKLIYAFKGDVVIDNNKAGTTDSVNSITTNSYFWCYDLWYSNKTVKNNFFSGIKGDYPVATNNTNSTFISCLNTDSAAFINNDIGGSDNPAANTASGDVIAIQGFASERSVVARNNKIRGITSLSRSVYGMSTFLSSAGDIGKLEIDSNSIHHLLSASTTTGIYLFINTVGINKLTNNNIYALKTTGTVPGNYGPTGTVTGIEFRAFYNSQLTLANGGIEIAGNKIHSFESVRLLSNSIFSHTAIMASSPVCNIWNNEIRFGIKNTGQAIDSLTSLTGISINSSYPRPTNELVKIEHNSVYLGGNGKVGSAITSYFNSSPINNWRNLYITNNILNVERTNSSTTPDFTYFEYINGFRTVSAKNLWYSSTIQNTPTLLQNFKQTCNCDSSSFTGNPAFINPAGDSTNFNLHPGIGSKADSAGTPPLLNIQTDLDAKNRNIFSPVDIGCYAVTPCGSGIFPSLSIAPSDDSVQLCTGGTATLAATVSNGSFQQLQWQRNLIDSIGANALSLTVNRTGDYRIIGKTACGQVASKTIYVVNYPLQKSVTITAVADTVCQSTPATFTATAVNCGSNLTYQWKVNGVNAGSNSGTFISSTLSNNDSVKVIVTTTVCSNNSTVTSNTIAIKVRASLIPATTITANTTTICAGNPVTMNFLAAVTNMGTNPVYQWQVNGVNTGTNSNAYSTNSLGANDQVKVMVTSNTGCGLPITVTSNILTITASAVVIPTVAITTSSTNVCAGISTTFTAAAVNQGSNATYQWKVNSINAGTNASTFSAAALNNNDQVNVVLTSSMSCAVPSTVASNILTITVQPSPFANAGNDTLICSGTFAQLHSTGGGTYLWTPANSLSNTAIANPVATPAATTNYTVTVTNSNGCFSKDSVLVSVQNLAPPVVTESNHKLTVINPDNTASYSWEVNSGGNWSSVVPAASGTSYSVTTAGLYRVKTVQYPCIEYSIPIQASLRLPANNAFGIYLYPNPANNFVILDELKLSQNWLTLELSDMLGHKIISGMTISNQVKITLSTNALLRGIYFIKLKNKNGETTTFKFIKL